MIKQLYCKLTRGHRFHGAPETFIDEHQIVHYRHTCIKCGKVCEWTVPWICVWRLRKAEEGEGNCNEKL